LEDLEKDRAAIVPLALIEDTPPTTTEGKTKALTPTIGPEEERQGQEMEGIRSESVGETALHPSQALAPIMQNND
ncbi:hypothetical protein Dimus_022388, partial [Dionaea muscipula]